MKYINVKVSIALLVLIQLPAHAGSGQLLSGSTSNSKEYLQIADADDRQDRRQERGRADERQDRRDCRQDEGRVGKDKRDCKQEEVRDGIRGNQGERLGGDDES
jgi:hypothetical protein